MIHPSYTVRADQASLKIPVIVAWLGTFVFSLATFRLLNDHFDRIARGRQIAEYGELPFRDFFDGGFFMTEFSSAAVLRLMGGALIGEVLLTASFIATGAAVVLVLARWASGSWFTAWVTMLLAVLAMPRAYDYDKFLLYPLGVLLCWRYVDHPTGRRLAALGAGIVAAGLFRHDHAVILLGLTLTAMLALYAGDLPRLARQTGWLVVAMGLTALPFLLFLHYQVGLGKAVDQVLTYVTREKGRFQLVLPAVSFDHLVTVETVTPPTYVIKLRWAPAVDDAARADSTERYSLQDPVADETDSRTYSFVIGDVSTQNLRALVMDARIEDTSGIDRRRYVVPEPLRTRLLRAMPSQRVRLHLSAANAQACLNYLFLVLPLAGAVMAVRMSRGAPTVRQERARVLSLCSMCLLLDLFILQPVEVRGGGMAGPIAVLASWVASRLWAGPPLRVAASAGPQRLRSAWWVRGTVVLLLAMTIWSESVMAEWEDRAWRPITEWAETETRLRAFSTSPTVDLAPGRIGELATYVHACTAAEDRVFTSWYVPDLYYFAQRGFAGGMAVTFGAHWSEMRFQRDIVDRLRSQSVPLVILELEGLSYFEASYPLVWQYVTANYRVAGESDFGNPYSKGYRVLVPTARPPVRTYPKWSMPCFA